MTAGTATYIQDLTTGDVIGSAVAGQSTTSLNDLTVRSGLVLFPSPAKDELQITVNQSFNIESVEILSLTGSRLFHSKLSEPMSEVNIPIHTLIPGTYVVRTHMKSGMASRSFVKE